MKKTLNIIFIITIIILTKLLLTFSINEIIIKNYKNNIYNDKLIKSLYILNINQPYIAYYNNGNIDYKNNNFNDAIDKYNKALNKKPPQKKVCDIRINLSLAIIKTIQPTDINIALEKLENARNNLYNNNCANPINNSGYSKKAEKLEEEIKKLEKLLNNNNAPSTNEQEETETENPKKEYEKIEKEIKQNQKEANANRQSELETYEHLEQYEYYSGKKW